jgi:hypothetical protein
MVSMSTLKGLGTLPLTVSNISVGLPTIPDNSNRAYIRVRGANVHMENDASAATTSAGVRVDDGSFINLTDARYNLSDFRFIRAGSVDATLDVSYFN